MNASSLENVKPAVVFVNASAIFLDVARQILEDAHSSIMSVATPYEAKEVANRAEDPLLFLVNDQQQHGNGLALIADLRKYAQVPIECVLITESTDPRLHAHAYDADVYVFCLAFYLGTFRRGFLRYLPLFRKYFLRGFQEELLSFLFFTERRLARAVERVTDTITGAYTRRGGENMWVQIWHGAKRNHTETSCIYIDVNDFKLFNDNYDHSAGDMVLRAVYGAIQHHVRPTDIIIRYGDEFSIMLPHTGMDNSRKIAERIKKHVGQLKVEFSPEVVLSVSVSVGVDVLDPGCLSFNPDNQSVVALDDLSNLLKKADEDMYRDKYMYRQGKAGRP